MALDFSLHTEIKMIVSKTKLVFVLFKFSNFL